MIALFAIALAGAQPAEALAQSRAAKLTEAEIEVDLQFSEALDRLRNCKPANAVKCYHWLQAIPRLQKEQAAWMAWKDAKADLMAVEMVGTSGENEVRTYFKIKMTKERSAELLRIGRE